MSSFAFCTILARFFVPHVFCLCSRLPFAGRLLAYRLSSAATATATAAAIPASACQRCSRSSSRQISASWAKKGTVAAVFSCSIFFPPKNWCKSYFIFSLYVFSRLPLFPILSEKQETSSRQKKSGLCVVEFRALPPFPTPHILQLRLCLLFCSGYVLLCCIYCLEPIRTERLRTELVHFALIRRNFPLVQQIRNH